MIPSLLGYTGSGASEGTFHLLWTCDLDFQEICDLVMFWQDFAVDILPADWQVETPHTELLMCHKSPR
jgi:hypothetical protein